jgi:hypothetical protein
VTKRGRGLRRISGTCVFIFPSSSTVGGGRLFAYSMVLQVFSGRLIFGFSWSMVHCCRIKDCFSTEHPMCRHGAAPAAEELAGGQQEASTGGGATASTPPALLGAPLRVATSVSQSFVTEGEEVSGALPAPASSSSHTQAQLVRKTLRILYAFAGVQRKAEFRFFLEVFLYLIYIGYRWLCALHEGGGLAAWHRP